MGRTRFSSDDGSVARARELRRSRTPAEAALWAVLRNRGLDGYKFRFQQRLGPYFGDFVCQSARLVVEVDGDTHYSEAVARVMPGATPIWPRKDIGLCGSPTTT